ncbi:hypothetical protein H0H92_005063 [Tricholoma furcatifolium]|nr:hypothetical protein H0H92_005063 [Tricholoma furcatifolium]
MATDFWASSHYKRWIVDRATLKEARADDLQYVEDPDHLNFLAIYFGSAISKLGKKLGLRQRAIATASVFFRRFYLKNSYCETDPFMVIAACCYVAAKAEESPIHIKNVVSEARSLFSREYVYLQNHFTFTQPSSPEEMYNAKYFPSDYTKLAEMEFYLVDDLECDLVVFHPYRTLLTLCKKENEDTASNYGSEEGEADEMGAGLSVDEGPRYWGTGEGRLELTESALQTAWFVINDTYRSDICLLHPPHIIAIAALYLTFIIHNAATSPSPPSHAPTPASIPTPQPPPQPQPQVRRSSRQHPASAPAPVPVAEPKQPPDTDPQDPIQFFADLNVSLPLIATVAQEIISLYTLWERYREGGAGAGGAGGGPEAKGSGSASASGAGQGLSPLPAGTGTGLASVACSPAKRSAAGSAVGTPMEGDEGGEGWGVSEEEHVTPRFLARLLVRMRQGRMGDLAHPPPSAIAMGMGHGVGAGAGPGGRPGVVNKILERTQAAG